MREHLIICHSFTLRCIYCLYKYPRSSIESHMQKCLKLTTPLSNISVNSKFFSKKEEKISFKKSYDQDKWFVNSPPEVLEGHPFTFKSDVYMYSLILWQILCPNENLYENQLFETSQLIRYIIRGLARPEIPSKVKPSVRILLQSCWNKDVSSRPNFSTILDYLLNFDKLTVKKLDSFLTSSPDLYLNDLSWLCDFENDTFVQEVQKFKNNYKQQLSRSANLYGIQKKDFLFSSSVIKPNSPIRIGVNKNNFKKLNNK
jgi:hypothetical protein